MTNEPTTDTERSVACRRCCSSPAATRRRLTGDSGVALLEAALLTPVFMVLVIGMLEYGLVYRDYLSLNSATSSGARSLAIFGNDSMADYNLLQALKKDLSAIPESSITKIAVFKADSGTDTTTWASCKYGSSITNRCNVYIPADWNRNKTLYFGCTPPGAIDKYWCPTSRKTAVADPPDYGGVYIRVVHPYISKLFGSSVTMESFVITRLEPQSLVS